MMKKYILISFVTIFLCISSVFSQQGHWTLQTSGTTQNLKAVFFVDSLTGWFCGETGTLNKTTDGGIHWGIQSSGTPKNFYDIYFIDHNNGWVVGDNGFKLHTTDGGGLWQADSVLAANQQLNGVHFADVNNGWVVGNNHTILHTTNGGITWNKTDTIGTESGAPQTLYSVFFTDPDTGWIVGGTGRIFHTTNGGTSWMRQAIGITSNHIYNVNFFNSNIGWAGGANGTFLHTTNGGNLWILQNSGSPYEIHGPFFTSSRCGWFVDNNSGIFYTSDRGTHWSAITEPTSQPYNDIYFPDSSHGCVVGNAGTVLKYEVPDTVISMVTDKIVALPDTIANRGDTVEISLTVSNVTLSDSIYSFEFKTRIDTSVMQIIGFDSVGFTAGGFAVDSNFITLDSFKMSGSNTHPLSGSGILLQLRYRMKPSITGIDTVVLKLASFYFNDQPAYVDSGRIIIAVSHPLYGDVSLNGTISAIDASLILQHNVNKIILDDTAKIAADVSGNGKINAFDASLILRWLVGQITSFPAGLKFPHPKEAYRDAVSFLTRLSDDDEYVEFAIHVKNVDDIYSVDISLKSSGLEFITSKKAGIFSSYLCEENISDGSLMLALAGGVPVYGEGDIVTLRFRKLSEHVSLELTSLVINDAEITVTNDFVSALPNKYDLSQNYPNPFNPETVIQYQLSEKCNVTIFIYNLLGQKVRTLMDNTMEQGYHSVTWNGANDSGEVVSSGIYFYTIRTNTGYMQSKKMVFLK